MSCCSCFYCLITEIGLQVVLLELFFGGAGLSCQAGLRVIECFLLYCLSTCPVQEALACLI